VIDWRRFFLIASCVLAGLLAGCAPSANSGGEENEAHFLKGKSRVSDRDYRGAIESFTEALVANPQSAAAHFQLGWLYAEKEADPAAAIYHYQRYLQFRPSADNAEIINQHVFRLKQDLAKAVMPLPSTPTVQRELETIAEENRRMKDELTRIKAFLTARGLSVTNLQGDPEIRRNPSAQEATQMVVRPRQELSVPPPQPRATARTHRVQAGESPASIARKYNVKLETFMTANPGLNPTRMQVGQTVNVPGQ
jgi:tetratricopeptide (TPR) repeat protein